MSTSVDIEEKRNADKKQRIKMFSYALFTPMLTRMNFVKDFVDIERYSNAQQELERVFSDHIYKHLAYIFEPLRDYNIIVIPRVYSTNEEAIMIKVITHLKGWENNCDLKKLMSVIIEKADTLKALGLHPLQVLYSLESSVKISEEVRQKVSGSIGVEVPIHAEAEAIYSKVEHKEVEATVTPEAIKMAVSAILNSISKPTILILSEKELEALGADTILSATIANRNIVVMLWLPSSPSYEFTKLITSERVATPFMPILRGTLKSHLVNMYIEVAKQLMPNFLQQHKRQLRKGLSNTITLLVNTGVLQKVIDRYIYDLVDPLLIVDATNKYVAKMYGLMMRNPESLLSTYNRSNRDVQKVIERELYALSEVVAQEAMGETLMRYGQEAMTNLNEMLLMVSDSNTVLKHLSSIGKELSYPIRVDKVIEFMRKTGIIALKATREGVYRLVPGIKYLYNTIKAMNSISTLSEQSTN